MKFEIERKFLVLNDTWRSVATGPVRIRQGYFQQSEPEVRIRLADEHGYLTIKGSGVQIRMEFEYRIPREDAAQLLQLFCSDDLVEKKRYEVDFQNATFVVDEFAGRHTGLVLAEIELDSASSQIQLPTWIGTEVTEDLRFRSRSLARYGLPAA